MSLLDFIRQRVGVGELDRRRVDRNLYRRVNLALLKINSGQGERILESLSQMAVMKM